jgi:small subunit ribosomal protein S2
VLEGKAASPQAHVAADDFVELDAEGNPVAKADTKPAPRRAPRDDKRPARRGPGGPGGDKRDAR